MDGIGVKMLHLSLKFLETLQYPCIGPVARGSTQEQAICYDPKRYRFGMGSLGACPDEWPWTVRKQLRIILVFQPAQSLPSLHPSRVKGAKGVGNEGFRGKMDGVDRLWGQVWGAWERLRRPGHSANRPSVFFPLLVFHTLEIHGISIEGY
jgi:hypothetical protein